MKPKLGSGSIVLIIAGLMLLLLLALALARAAELAGDTVELKAIFRDENGVAAVPSSAVGFVFRDGVAIDSSASLAGGEITRYHSTLTWEYTIPSTSSDSSRFVFLVKASDATITDDWLPCIPSSVCLQAVTDTISPAAAIDLSVGAASDYFAVIDSTVTPGDASDAMGIYDSNGSAITGAFVYVTTDSNLQNIIGTAKSTLGNYYIWIPLDGDPNAADSVYVSAWYQNTWVKSSTLALP